MGEILILPRTLLYLNQDNGAGVYWDRREGLLIRGSAGRWGRTTEADLPAWQRWTTALLKIAIRLNAAAEQIRPNVKPLNTRPDFVLESG